MRIPNRCHASEILSAVVRCSQLSLDDICGPDRHRSVVCAREVASFLMHHRTSLSYPEVAQLLCRPSHSTVVSASSRLRNHRREDAMVLLSKVLTMLGVVPAEITVEADS